MEDREDIHDFITRARACMIKDLHVDVIQFLHDEECLTIEEFRHITGYETRENQIICLLDQLPSKGKNFYDKFRSYIDKYYWWIKEKSEGDFMTENHDLMRISKILNEADVPALPFKHVSRKDEFAKLNNYLNYLKRGEYVVVSGMGGCGKSTLVVEVLHQSPTLVLDTFHKKIFWLTIGRESALKKDVGQEGVKELTTLQELYTRLFISRGYNAPPLPMDIKSAKRVLKDKFSEPELEDCLLILDDVPSSSFIECLNIGCKILVTTDNKDIMKDIRNTIRYVKLSEGFTEKESLDLFAKNLDSSSLPNQAKHIHALCKGFPLTISLVASQLAEFRDDVLHNNERWEAYVNHLQNKDIEAAIGRYDENRQEQVTLLYKALEMSIGSLDYTLQKLYQDFAVFMDDVNIRPEVLCTLWEMNKKEVEDIMLQFEKKCLVIITWNLQLLSYVYSVHDLLLDYLKRNLTKCERQALHRKLITSYEKKYGNDMINFPRNDNYIFLYLGYHLKEAGYLDKFRDLYFNLKFIETKILTHGPADVLYDYKKYKDCMVKENGENGEKYEEFSNFISRIGVCRALSTSDIVQFGLAECKESSIYKQAQQLAKRSTKLYFEYLTEASKDCSSPEVHYIQEIISTAVFSKDGNVIVANNSGDIKLMDLKKQHSIITFKGHREKVTRLQLAKNGAYFLSASNDSAVRIWNLNNFSDWEWKSVKPRTPSPTLMQQAHSDPWKNQRSSGEPSIHVLEKHSLPIIDAQFSNDGMTVVSSGEDKKVIIWKFAFEKTKQDYKLALCGNISIDVDHRVVSCSFTKEDDMIICAAENGRIVLYESSRGTLKSFVDTDSPIKSIAVIPEAPEIQVLILGKTYFSLSNISRQSIYSCTLQNSYKYSTLRKRNDHCICTAVSGDGKYVAVASSSYDIVIREVKTEKEIAKFHETNGKICGLDWSSNNNALLATYENKVLKIWKVQNNDDASKPAKLKQSVFDAAWIPYQDDDSKEDGLLITAVLDYQNNINIFYDLRPNKVITQKPSASGNDSICQLCVCPNDGSVIYATKTGFVHLIVLDKWTSHDIMKLDCFKVLKMKLFYQQSAMVVILLVEKIPWKYSLVAWIKNDITSDEFSGYEVEYVKENEHIFDFDADLKNMVVYVAKFDHTCDIYDLKSGDYKTSSCNDEKIVKAKFCDFSPNFEYMATGNDSQVILTSIENNKKSVWNFEEIKSTVCKFSCDGRYLAVGFACGLVQVYDMHDKSIREFRDKSTKVLDLTWSPQDYRLIVVLDKDIILYDIDCRLISILYMSVDKVLCNDSFSKIITIDNTGNFHVLKHPL